MGQTQVLGATFCSAPSRSASNPRSARAHPYQWSFTQDTAGLYLQDQIKLPYNFFLLAGARYQYIHQTVATGEAPVELQPSRAADRTGADAALWPAVAAAGMAEPLRQLHRGFRPERGIRISKTSSPRPPAQRAGKPARKLEFFGGKLRASRRITSSWIRRTCPTADPNPAHVCAGGGGLPGGRSLLAGAARSKGPELDIQGEILPGWNVIATYTNDDVRPHEGRGPDPSGSAVGQTGALAVGERFPGVARNQASLWKTLRIPKRFRPQGLQDRRRIPLHGLEAGQRHPQLRPLRLASESLLWDRGPHGRI